MHYFTTEFIDFFEELTKNNTKQWFNANRKRYEKYVKQPFQNFVEEMISRIRADDPVVDISSRDAIFRINRDIRFSKNKTLYKTHVSAMISPGGRKNKCIPASPFSIFLEKPFSLRIDCPKTGTLSSLVAAARECILNKRDSWENIVQDYVGTGYSCKLFVFLHIQKITIMNGRKMLFIIKILPE